MKKYLILSCLVLITYTSAFGFCGFYVAKANAKLFNKSSQVIMARNGNKTSVTMFSDFQGDVKDFAMVVPVPVILKKKDIRVVNASIFTKLDAYSGPRLVEYHEYNPCGNPSLYYKDLDEVLEMSVAADAVQKSKNEDKKFGVTIEAKYTVGEYDILILSAEESDGLKTWLTKNGYKLPKGTSEVLEPYIKSDMKFFVVKVNLEAFENSGTQDLSPIQITYHSSNFMLPIRLGMANAESTQDMILYAFTENGRIETTNYRTLKIPTDKNIPTFIKEHFGEFYKDLFKRTWKKNKQAVYLEYAWDLSSDNFVKCDPCATTPPTLAELTDAGVFWAEKRTNNRWGGSDYEGKIYFTRLHVRYDRKHFPQDLLFQETPDRTSFQGRYIMTHPAPGDFECEAGQTYLKGLVKRRQNEIKELKALTGSYSSDYAFYVNKYKKLIKDPVLEYVSPGDNDERGSVDPIEPVGTVKDPVQTATASLIEPVTTVNNPVTGVIDTSENVTEISDPDLENIEYVSAIEEDGADESQQITFSIISPYLLSGLLIILGLYYLFMAFKPKKS